jgi:hypothetical protein
MSDIEVDGFQFRIGRMTTTIQLLVVKRLAPVMQGMTPLFALANRQTLDAEGNVVPDQTQITIFDVLAALSNTINLMSDTDAMFVRDACLDCVRWRQGDRWQPLRAPGGVFMLGDADTLDTQLRLMWEVLRESLGNFSLAKLLGSPQEPNGQDMSEPVQMAMTRPNTLTSRMARVSSGDR